MGLVVVMQVVVMLLRTDSLTFVGLYCLHHYWANWCIGNALR